MSQPQPQAILTLPHLRVQNANAISSALTHGFPSITAFTGLMWALQRKLAQACIPLKLLSVGVVCHHHQEQVSQGYVRTFSLSRNPIDKDGSTAAIVEEGRMHLQVSLVFGVALQPGTAASALHSDEQQKEWAAQISDIVAQMRVARCCLPALYQAKKSDHGWRSSLKAQSKGKKTFAPGAGNGCQALRW